jgi:hypothetical protein
MPPTKCRCSPTHAGHWWRPVGINLPGSATRNLTRRNRSARSGRCGVTRNQVLGLEAVLATGEGAGRAAVREGTTGSNCPPHRLKEFGPRREMAHREVAIHRGLLARMANV